MTVERFAFAASAWWEVLHQTPSGTRLAKQYLEKPGIAIITIDFALAELSAKLHRLGRARQVPSMLAGIATACEVVPIGPEAADHAGRS